MTINDLLRGVTRLFLDSAPVIYYIEKHPKYFPVAQKFFEPILTYSITAVTSPVTLAECLVLPFRAGSISTQQDFVDTVTNGNNVIFTPIDQYCGQLAARLRARYNLSLADAMQLAVALSTGCEALLTNDTVFRRVTELQVIILDDFLNP